MSFCVTFLSYLWQGFAHSKNLITVQKILLEMKTCLGLVMDWTAYTTMVDALLHCGLTKCMFTCFLIALGPSF